MSAPDDFDLTRASSPAGDRSSSSDPFEKLEGSEYATSSSADGPARVRRRPIPRKGHTKSRNGCFNCKRRKIKCPENIPECFNCKRLGMSCEYPPANKLTVAALSGPLGVTPVTFNMDDMRFFQHFILTAYPPLPLGGDAVWKDVTAMSHQVGNHRPRYHDSQVLTSVCSTSSSSTRCSHLRRPILTAVRAAPSTLDRPSLTDCPQSPASTRPWPSQARQRPTERRSSPR